MITSIISFVIAFGLLVLVHEFGHFWVARRTGIAVEKFSIGFGPKLFGFRWRETTFQISLLPLGGFVKMKGESDEEEVDPNDKTAFSNKSVLIRSMVVAAGPFMNLILSFLLLPLVFWIGRPEAAFLKERPVIERILPHSPAEKAGLKPGDIVLALDGKETATWSGLLQTLSLQSAGKKLSLDVERGGAQRKFWLEVEKMPGGEEGYLGFEKFFGKPPSTVVGEVDPNGPAGQAGIQGGDRLLAIDGAPVADWDELVRRIQSFESRKFQLEAERKGESLKFEITPRWDEKTGRYLIGIQGGGEQAPLDFFTHRYPIKEAILVGFKTNWDNFLLTLAVLKKLVTLELSYKTLGGPVRIAYTLARASASGLADFLYFTAFLSLQLAVLNLLPIPVLDGGHIVFFFIEALRRKPLSMKTRLVAQQVGMVFLLTLILIVTWNDIEKLFLR